MRLSLYLDERIVWLELHLHGLKPRALNLWTLNPTPFDSWRCASFRPPNPEVDSACYMEKFDDINMTSRRRQRECRVPEECGGAHKNTNCSDGQWKKMHLDFQVAYIMSAAITSKSTACKSRALLHDFYQRSEANVDFENNSPSFLVEWMGPM